MHSKMGFFSRKFSKQALRCETRILTLLTPSNQVNTSSLKFTSGRFGKACSIAIETVEKPEIKFFRRRE